MLGETWGRKNRLGKNGEKPELSPTRKTYESRALCAESSWAARSGRQTDVQAFVPYGTTSARHREQPSHAENRPTKREAVCEQFAGSTPGVLSVRTCFQQWLGLTLHILGQGAEMQDKNPGWAGGLAQPSSAADEIVHPLPKKCSYR